MRGNYSVVNLRSYLDAESPACMSEADLYALLSEFSSPKNADVEHFLHTNAVEFTKKSQSVTYLVFADDTAELVGYFSVAVKPLSIRAANISKTVAKKLSRVSILDKDDGTFTASAYLLAQFGKNYALQKDRRIAGGDLLELALSIIDGAKYTVGGVLEFLECEDNPFLLNFYTEHGFKPFDTRCTASDENTGPHTLHQLLKFI